MNLQIKFWIWKKKKIKQKKIYIYIKLECFFKMYWAMCCCVLPMMVKWWKKWIDYVKVGSIWIKILSAIACNLNWMKIQLDPNSNSIEEKWYVNWCVQFLKSTCKYGVKKNSKIFFKWKDKFSNLFNLGIN
jgi:hypothetical protein